MRNGRGTIDHRHDHFLLEGADAQDRLVRLRRASAAGLDAVARAAGLDHWSIYHAGAGFHSPEQFDYLVRHHADPRWQARGVPSDTSLACAR